MAKERDSEESQSGNKKSRLTLIIIILLLLVLGSGGLFLYLMMSSNANTSLDRGNNVPVDNNGGDYGGEQQGSRQNSGDIGVNYDLSIFTVNLIDPSGVRYLKVGISMSLPSKNKDLATEIENRLPKLKDTVITILSSKTFEEITTPQGKIALRQEILRRINSILTKGKVMEIYLTEFVVQ